MAVGTSYSSIDMHSSKVWYGSVTVANSNHIQVASGGYVQNYYGFGFTYSGYAVTGGTVTSTNYYEFGTKIYEITGASLSAVTVATYVQSGNLQGVLAYALSSADVLNGSFLAEFLKGFAGNDVIYGNGGNDFLMGGAGNDRLDGGHGIDFAFYEGNRNWFSMSTSNGTTTVSDNVSGQGVDSLVGVERLLFADGAVALDLMPIGNIDDPATKGEGGNAGRPIGSIRRPSTARPTPVGSATGFRR